MNVDRIYEDYKSIPLKEDDKIFIEGYIRAIDDVENFFFNMDIYECLGKDGYLGHIMEDNSIYDNDTWKDYLSSCIEDWLVSHRKEIEISFKDQYED